MSMQFRQKLGTLPWIAAGVLAGAAPAWAWNPNINFCFPESYTAPTINGDISDSAWGYASRYVYDQGVMVPDLSMLGASNSGSLYLSFVVNHDASWSSGDAVVVAFEAPGGARKALVLLLGQANGSAIVPNGFSLIGTSWVSDPVPANTTASASYNTANGGSWTLELQVPLAAYGLPAQGNFGFYANTLPVDPDLVTDHPWPPGTAVIGGVFNPTSLSGLPSSTVWGQGKTTASATACGGVSISSSDIYATNSVDTTTHGYKIATNADNTFHAFVGNSSTDINGNPVAATNITTRFKLAQFGISSNWIDAPHTGQPTPNPTTAATIPAGGTDQTMMWTLSASEIAQYNTPATRHQCIRVELDHSGPSTAVFTNRVAQVNMDFGLASRFSSQPQIDPRGWPAPPAGQTNQRLVLRSSQRIDTLDRNFVKDWLDRRGKGGDIQMTMAASDKGNAAMSWDSMKSLQHFPVEGGAEFDNFVTLFKDILTQTSQMTYLVHGCRRTGQFIEINSHKYERCDDVGAFGNVIRHVGLGNAKWDVALSGAGLERTGDRFELTLAPDKPVTLNTVVDANDQIGGKGGGCGGLAATFKNTSTGLAASGLALFGFVAWRPRRRKAGADVKDALRAPAEE
jgi:hypothetical protein